MRSDKLFSILVIAGGALASGLQACNSATPDPKDSGSMTTTDTGTKPQDSGTNPQDTGTIQDSGKADTGVGAEFW